MTRAGRGARKGWHDTVRLAPPPAGVLALSPPGKLTDEERAQRRALNQIVHVRAQRHGMAFKAEQRAPRERVARERREAQEREDEAANLQEAIDRYGFDLPI